MANWYLNSGSPGSGGYDGIAPSSAWRTIERPIQGSDIWTGVGFADTGGPVTGAGDIVWIYDGHSETWTSADLIRLQLNGSTDENNPVIYRGDITGSQAWGSAGGGSRPLVTLASNNNCSFDDFSNTIHVRFEHIDFVVPAGGTATPANFFDIDTSTVEFVDCTWTGMWGRWRLNAGGMYAFEDCELDWYRTASQHSAGMFQNYAGTVRAKRTVFGGNKFFVFGASQRPTIVECEDVEFLAPVITGGSAIVLGVGGTNGWDMQVNMNGIKIHEDWASYVSNQSAARRSMKCTFTNWDDNPRIYRRYESVGDVQSTETGADLFAGGADQATIVTPTSLCSEFMGGVIAATWHIWAPASSSRTYSVKVALDDGAGGAWSGYPTADELVFELGYFDTASAVSRTWVQSTDVVSSTAETTLEISGISPAEPGHVQLRVILKTNDGGTGERLRVDNRVRVH